MADNLSARAGDGVLTGHGCDGTTTLASPSQSTVYVEGILACRLGDNTVSHEITSGITCVPHTASIAGSSGSVYIEAALAARVNDACDANKINSSTQSTVIIGD